METVALRNRLKEYIDHADVSELKILLKIIDTSEEFEPDTPEEYNADIDRAIKDMDNGEFYTQEEAIKRSKNW